MPENVGERLISAAIVVNVHVVTIFTVTVNVTIIVDVAVHITSTIAVHVVTVNIARRSAKGAGKKPTCLFSEYPYFKYLY